MPTVRCTAAANVGSSYDFLEYISLDNTNCVTFNVLRTCHIYVIDIGAHTATRLRPFCHCKGTIVTVSNSVSAQDDGSSKFDALLLGTLRWLLLFS